MAYEIGVVNNITDLQTFIRASCTAHGWTLAGSVLYKGNCYVRTFVNSLALAFQGGTGKDGSNNLTGGGPNTPQIRWIGAQALTYPMTCEVHVNTSPDEVYVVVKFATDFYEWAAWGVSDVPGLTGTGNWYGATAGTYGFGNNDHYSSHDGGTMGNSIPPSTGGAPLFWGHAISDNSLAQSFIHGDVDGRGWHGSVAGGAPFSHRANANLLGYQPNAWNGETILLPYPVYVARTSGSKYTMVADLKHIRHVRLDYHEVEDIITLGADKWKLYPWFRKDSVNQDGVLGGLHSGTIGYALRYTGP